MNRKPRLVINELNLTPMYNLPAFIMVSKAVDILRLCNALLLEKHNSIECDASNLKFVDPFGMCLLASTCHKLSLRNKRVNIQNIPDKIVGYLVRMDLFENCNIPIKDETKRFDRRDALVEVQRIESPREIDNVSAQLANAIVGSIPGIDYNAPPDEMSGYKPHEKITIPLRYMFSELLENSLRHGRKNGFNQACVWVASQYYPSKDLIRLAVVDNGCGYLATLDRHPKLISNDHFGAIKTALLPEVSCNPDLDVLDDTVNMGIGLTVVNDLVQTASGMMSIGSGDALLRIENSREEFVRIPNWQGVLISLEIKRELLKDLKIHSVIRKYQPTTAGPGLKFE